MPFCAFFYIIEFMQVEKYLLTPKYHGKLSSTLRDSVSHGLNASSFYSSNVGCSACVSHGKYALASFSSTLIIMFISSNKAIA